MTIQALINHPIKFNEIQSAMRDMRGIYDLWGSMMVDDMLMILDDPSLRL